MTSKNRPLRILVVDDDALAIELFWRDLPADQFSVLTAANGAEALELLRAEPFDLLVTDVVMPGMNGLQLIAAVRATSQICHLPILVATGYSAHSTRIACLQAGADDCMTKPFPRLAILPLLERLVLRRQRQLAAR